MSYVPHTSTDVDAMLRSIGVDSVEKLFETIPEAYRFPDVVLPEAISELEVMRELRGLAERNTDVLHAPCFLGAGAYHHFIPSVVSHLVGRAEFYTAYTPYQPEVSQGTLQSVFEYQSMVCDLTGMDVSNASHYDGATSLAEAVIMAANVHRGKRSRVVVSRGVHPEYRETMRTYTVGMGLDYVGDDATVQSAEELQPYVNASTACVIVQNPDFVGHIIDLAPVASLAHQHGALLIVVCNPISLGLLAPPGRFGADIVVGEGQALGNALSFGGPYLGIFACKEEYVRRMSGRLVGETVDAHGRRGYVLTLSTREQHIRRERATSNICTNQGLNALAAAVYLAALGRCGLRQVAELCYHKAHYAAEQISRLPGMAVDTSQPFFNEFVVRCPAPVEDINRVLFDKYGILGGYDLERALPERRGEMLLCVTEMNGVAEIDRLVDALRGLGS